MELGVHVSQFTFPGGAPADRQIKSLVYVATDGATQAQYMALALLRGDHQLHETKLADSLGASAVRPAHPEEIVALLGAGAGSLGGVGASEKARAAKQELRVVADHSLKGRRDMTTGANEDERDDAILRCPRGARRAGHKKNTLHTLGVRSV